MKLSIFAVENGLRIADLVLVATDSDHLARLVGKGDRVPFVNSIKACPVYPFFLGRPLGLIVYRSQMNLPVKPAANSLQLNMLRYARSGELKVW